jgi:glycerol kinase
MSSESSEALYLVIDQGGHSTRAFAFDRCGQIVAQAKFALRVYSPQKDRAEIDPESLVSSGQTVLADLSDQLGARVAQIKAAGLATQRSNVACWDKRSGAALSPVISWQDRRASQWVQQFTSYNREIHNRTGLLLTAHYGASKLRWCLEHLPEVREAYRKGYLAWGPMASFLNFRLTVERRNLVDPANASRTLLWNINSRDWDTYLVNLFDVPKSPLPTCTATRDSFGTLQFAGASVPVDIMTGDQSSALFAFGKPDTNTVYINIGTGAFLQKPTQGRVVHTPRLLSSVVYADAYDAQYVVECTVNGAGSALTQVESELNVDRQWAEDQFEHWLAQYNEPPLFLNGVSGLGTPYWVPNFPSRFVGEGSEKEKIVAVGESILFLVKVNLEELEKTTGNSINRIVLTGGMAQSDGLCQRFADLTGLKIHRPHNSEATAQGTAYLLANCPRQWEVQAGNEFCPLENRGIKTRYKRWRREMENALKYCQSTVVDAES